jgi:hypothetical protein
VKLCSTANRIVGAARATAGHGFLWISKPARHNILSTLRRYREPYHHDGAPVDWYPRGILLDHFFGEGTTPEQFATASYASKAIFAANRGNWKQALKANRSARRSQRQGHVWTQDANSQPVQRAAFDHEKDGTARRFRRCFKSSTHFATAAHRPLHVWWGSEWNIAPERRRPTRPPLSWRRPPEASSLRRNGTVRRGN